MSNSKYSKSEAMNRFKMECASDVGGQMTKKLVEAQMKAMAGK